MEATTNAEVPAEEQGPHAGADRLLGGDAGDEPGPLIHGILIYELLKDVSSIEPENIRLLTRIADLVEAHFVE